MLGLRVGPHSVQVDAAPVGAVVAAVDPIRVKHGYELEDETRALVRIGARVRARARARVRVRAKARARVRVRPAYPCATYSG